MTGNGDDRLRLTDLPLVPVACAMCGSDEAKVIVSDPPFEVRRCGRCAFVYVSPRVPDDEIHRIYGDEYFQSDCPSDYGYGGYLEDAACHRKTFRKKARFVTRFKQSGRLLEIGAAGGFFLDEMRRRGFQVEGVELSPRACAFAREQLGIETIHNARLQDLDFAPASFDLIVAFDVIEHLADPFTALRDMRRLLAPDGVLVLQTQNVASLAARVLGRRWHHYKHLEHIYHFDPDSMRRALAEAGLETLELTAGRSGKYISLAFFIERMRRYNRIAHLLLKPLEPLGHLRFYVNPFDEMLVAARPET
ncbi:MAG: class I SAM-dependent methyltransferase [Planctomycetes bacterium]|nr:class I SAM-dependent methyltransferase [Planctomycetota bacterium]